MTPADLLANVGRALFGERWKSDMDQALGIKPGRSDDWSKGRGEPPPGVWQEVRGLLVTRRVEIDRLLPQLEYLQGGIPI